MDWRLKLAKRTVDFEGDEIKLTNVELVTKVSHEINHAMNSKVFVYFIQINGTRHKKSFYEEDKAKESRLNFIKLLR